MADTNKINMDLLLQELQGGGTTDSLRFKELFYLCLSKWKWFVLSVVLTVGLATFYILRTPAVYTRSAFLMVKEDSKGKAIGSDVASMFADLGLSQANANVNNELLAMQMPSVVRETVKRLGLDWNYYQSGLFHRELLYGKELPVKVEMGGLADDESVSLTLRLLPGGKMELDDFESSARELESRTVAGVLNDTIDTPAGRMAVRENLAYAAPEDEAEEYPRTIYVSRTNLYDCTDACKEKLAAELSSEDATVIELSYEDVSIPRAEDVLNTVIAVYNEEWIRDKNQITVSTSQFITDRLGVLEHELGDVDADISTYKSANLLPDADKASELYMEQAQETNRQILDLNTRISMARYIRNYLTGGNSRNQLLPVNSGLENPGIESQIAEYNNEQLRRNNLLLNTNDQNPLIIAIDRSLTEMRGSIISSIDNLLVSLDTQRNELMRNEQRTTARIAANPDQTKYLQSVGRQQKVKEALYLFLLQKREENELSQAFTPYNMRILTPPSGNLEPVAPKKKRILALAFLAGLVIPLAVVIVRENMNTTVRGRKDLTRLDIPFVGEIPLCFDRKESWKPTFGRKGLFRKRHTEERRIVVREGRRDIMNEAFRVLRTNMEFMAGNGTEIFLMTSYNPGSGKTFLTMNIAMSLAIKGKKVLVIDGDLRHGSLSAFVDSPKTGLSDWLAGRTGTWRNIIRRMSDEQEGADVIPVGIIPPNPTELISSSRLEGLLTEVRSEYDCVFIDSPPVDIVADVQIFGKLADRTFFVVRAGLLERTMLTELEDLYRQKKFPNMAVILNGTTNESGRYGYRYRYRYGYRYGYHYYNEESGSE